MKTKTLLSIEPDGTRVYSTQSTYGIPRITREGSGPNPYRIYRAPARYINTRHGAELLREMRQKAK